ncbi:MAG: glycogen/starch/alpha-glucan phosphorylase, partial [Candidatus Cloacimonetes bacterium]|nr:glycogen/starch/alpha-glucan phosphorylase [Candidatus Cloacimonadota bacterium]
MEKFVAYFSAEWGLSDELPIYAGGLGILAADILKQSSDSNFPLVGIGLFYHEGFFRQKVDKNGNQIEENFSITPQEANLEEVIDPETGKPLFIEIGFPKEPAAVKVWKKQIGNTPLFLLDAQIPINKDFEQKYTAHLYEGEWSPFIEQEIL